MTDKLTNPKIGKIDFSRLYREAELCGGKDEIVLRTIDLSDEIPVKQWDEFLQSYGDSEKMVYIGKHDFRPVNQFVYGECPLCHEQMQSGTSYMYEGITAFFTCGSHREGAKHRFVWSKGFAFPLVGANTAFLGALMPKNIKKYEPKRKQN